jgi:hypothetical protein
MELLCDWIPDPIPREIYHPRKLVGFTRMAIE